MFFKVESEMVHMTWVLPVGKYATFIQVVFSLCFLIESKRKFLFLSETHLLLSAWKRGEHVTSISGKPREH